MSQPRTSRQTPRRPAKRFYRPSLLFYYLLAVLLFDGFIAISEAKDYYSILGVSRDADSATIKRAFRKLAVKYHPDKNPGDKSAEKMYTELSNAYEVLSDNNKRQRYDMYGEDGLKNGGGGGGMGDDDDDDGDDFFGGMFGGAFGGRRRQRREERRVADVVIPFPTSLETLYNGGVVEAVHRRRVICDKWSDCETTCPKCKGRGFIIQVRQLGPGFVQQIQTTCPVCGGTGKITKKNCKSCPNGQFEQVEKTLLIDIERGMKDGQHISFDGQTDEVPDHASGNVHFEVVGLPHQRFKRVGDDLHYTLRVSLSEALVGINREVKQLDGRMIPIKTDKVISPGEKLTIEGEGMPVHDQDRNGSLVVQFWVNFPASLTDEQKKDAISLHGELPSLESTNEQTRIAEESQQAVDENKDEL